MLPESELRRKEVDRTNPAAWLVERPLSEPSAFARSVTHFKLTSSLTDLIYSFSAARTLFRPHQFKPVLKVVESPVHRLLLADEVGLGKTIEAGLIWTELDARSPLRRVLMVTPPGLVEKWQLEMRRRFDREVRALSAQDLLDFIDLYAERGDSSRLTAVIGYPQLRNARVVDALTNRPATFDLAIFDEAHVLRNANTKTHQAAKLVAQNTESVIFLSATPVNLGSDDLFNLLHLLRPDEFNRKEGFAAQLAPNANVNRALRLLTASFPPNVEAVADALKGVEQTSHAAAYRGNPLYSSVLNRLQGELGHGDVVELQGDLARLNSLAHVYTRTRKRDLRDQTAVRRPHRIRVELTPIESELHDATLALVSELRRRATGAAPGLAAVMPARQAASCLPAMRTYVDELARKNALVLDRHEGEEDDEADDVVDGGQLEIDDSLSGLLEWIRLLRTRLGDTDTKFDALITALAEFDAQTGARRQVLLFSFFRLTLAHLDEKLSSLGYRCAQMHGGTPMKVRSELLAKFRAGEIDILLCSEVGSEGLDFEFCDVLVNYDLPWNPMKLEQRIGRLDRFGQKNPVIHVLNFEIESTVDTEIFLRLYDRIGIFESSIGELEPIMGATVRELTRSLLSLELTTAEQRALADRLALAVMAEKRNVEEFDRNQESLVGADSYVDRALDDIRDQHRYLTPPELARYVGGFLRDAAHPARLVATDQDPSIFALHGSPLLADRLRRHGAGMLTPDFGELITTLETGGPVMVTFDSERAYGSTSVFLAHTHPLVRSITRYYSEPENALSPGGYISLPAPSDRVRGRWVFYVFMLAASGMLPQRSLMAVAVHADSKQVDVDVGAQVLSYLSGPDVSQMRQDEVPMVDRDVVVSCYERVLADVAARREEMRDRLVERNEALVASRTASLQRELEVRRASLHEMASRPGLDERIRRMRTSQIRNLEMTIHAKISELEEQRSVSVRFQVVLGGVADLQ